MADRTKTEKPNRQQPMTAENKRQMRRRKARRLLIVRAISLVLVCVLLVFLWQNWDWVAPDKLLASFSDWLDGGDGSYPVELSGTEAQRLCRVEDYTVLLTDSHLIYYDENGAEMSRYNCAFPTGLVRTAGDYVLLAEQGGQRLHLSTRSGVELELQAERKILSAALNEDGRFAVLTDGPQGYLVQVKVYDHNGKVLYTRSRNRTATDVALAADGEQVALLSVVADKGSLTSYVEVFDLDSAAADATHTHTEKDVLLYRLAYFGGKYLMATGEERLVAMNTNDGSVALYQPEEMHILGYAVAENHLAVALRPYGDTGDGEIHILNGSTAILKIVPFTGDFRQLAADEDGYLVLTDRYVQQVSEEGAGNQAPVEADSRQVVPDGDRAVVLGLNRLNSHELRP